MKYHGVMHMHSTHSYDGKVSLPNLKALLQTEGIAFACMTEHTDTLTPETAAAFVAECRELSDQNFVFVPGFEIPYVPQGTTKEAHILLIGATEFVGTRAVDAAALRAAASTAQLTILAHPVRNDFVVDDPLRSVLQGVEIWNQQYDGQRVPRTASYQLCHELRHDMPDLLATGSLDFHRKEHLTWPRVTIELTALREESILTALASAKFDFGNQRYQIPARGVWHEARAFGPRLLSALSCTTVALGKAVNRGLAALGLSLPKSLKRLIRSRV